MDRNIEVFIACDKNYDESKIVLFGAPFDSTSSYRPGSRFAPKEIRANSYGLETYSPYQGRDLADSFVFDAGDLELRFGAPGPAVSEIQAFTEKILDDGKTPFMIGGEHLVTLGAFRAAHKKYPDIHVVHFDAHTDLRDDYLGEKLSHATVIRRVWELAGDNKIYQFGIRSGEGHEFEFAEKHMYLNKYNLSNFGNCIDALRGKPVYFTIDLDILDPSVFPGTGTPEAGGVSFLDLLDAVIKTECLNIVGLDVNELCPVYDQSGVSTATACKIIRELLLTRQ
ncbi:MAG: agmatinase [Clostridiales bacterium]|jgi:agmatinase|nr:agmatinase [Clostridiales bacterium]